MSFKIYTLGLALAAIIAAPITGYAAEKFIPKGHSYSPDSPSLPHLNSTQDQLNGQTDIYESEIYQKQLNRALWEADMRRAINRDHFPGPSRKARY